MSEQVFNQHPIQLKGIAINEISFKRTENIKGDDKVQVNIMIGNSGYLPDEKKIIVGMKVICGSEQHGFKMVVEISGHFEVDNQNFDIAKIPHWVNNNAPFILQPYLRENVYSLCIRVGIEPIILPLTQVPTSKSPEKI
jgi:preprotein translocase subunit SecB